MVRMATKQNNLWLVTSVLLATAAFCGAEPPRAVPTFHCISLYWNVEGGAADNTCQVRYRPKDSAAWQTAMPLWYDGRGPKLSTGFIALTGTDMRRIRRSRC